MKLKRDWHSAQGSGPGLLRGVDEGLMELTSRQGCTEQSPWSSQGWRPVHLQAVLS